MIRRTVMFAFLCFAGAPIEVQASDKSPYQVQLILFVPADVDPPTEYQPRVDQIVEPAESNGLLKLWFAFEDGTQAGDGRSRGRKSGISKAYTYRRKQWTFN